MKRMPHFFSLLLCLSSSVMLPSIAVGVPLWSAARSDTIGCKRESYDSANESSAGRLMSRGRSVWCPSVKLADATAVYGCDVLDR